MDTKEIKRVPIDSIRPDPQQPRTVFVESDLKHLGENLKKEGFINPIEVDGTGMIITGERRYRAAKMAGMKEVDVQINRNKFTEYDRFRHQVAENEHQSGGRPMNPIDRAHAFKRMLEMKGHKVSPRATDEKAANLGIRELSREISISKEVITEFLNLLWQPKSVQQKVVDEYMQKGSGLGWTLVREISRAPKGIQKELQRRITKGSIRKREDIRRISQAAEESIDEGFAEMRRQELKKSTAANAIYNRIGALGLALREYPTDKLSEAEVELIKDRLDNLQRKIDRYIRHGTLEVIEGEATIINEKNHD